MRSGETFITTDGKIFVGIDAGVFGGPGNVEAGDGEVGGLDIEAVCIAHGAVSISGDCNVGYSRLSAEPTFDGSVQLTLRPLIDRMSSCILKSRIQVFPQDIKLIV